MTNAADSESKPEDSAISLKEFLEKVPRLEARPVANFTYHSDDKVSESIPSIWLWCDSGECEREGWFDSDDTYVFVAREGVTDSFLDFKCRHCAETTKTYAITGILGEGKTAILCKYGELPDFGEHLPTALYKLVGRDEYFRRGWRAERAGLGIGAFAYYRRVVESHKTLLFDLIRSVAEKEGADADLLAQIDAAKKETQFDKAVEMIKAGLPSSLRYERHSPLQLLHEALSQGMHAESDEACLELASAIRRVLAFLTERAATVAKDHDELKESVARLLEVQRERRAKREERK